MAFLGYVNPTVSGNTMTGNTYQAFLIRGSTPATGTLSYRLSDIQGLGWPYVVDVDDYTITSNATLTIDSGIVIKSNGQGIIVQGTLDCQGTEEHPVVFTSFRDDTYGGDANGDGTATRPAPGDWDSLSIENDANELHHCLIRYATYGIRAYQSSPGIHDCTIDSTGTCALYLTQSSSVVTRCVFLNSPTALHTDLGNPVITNSLFSGCPAGVIVNNQGSAPLLATITNCNFSDVTGFISTTNNTADHTVEATGNWFGTSDAAVIAANISENLAEIQYEPFASAPVTQAWRRGDFNFSNRVDGIDLNLFATAFGTVPGETNYRAICDLHVGTPDRIDGFDLAGFTMHFGRTGIPLSKCRRIAAKHPNIVLQEIGFNPSTKEYEIPVAFKGQQAIHSIAFDVVLPEGCTFTGFDRGSLLQEKVNNALVLYSNQGNRYIIGVTLLEDGDISSEGLLGTCRFTSPGESAGSIVASLEHCAVFTTSGEIIPQPAVHVSRTVKALPSHFRFEQPNISPQSSFVTFSYQIPQREVINIGIYDMSGKRIATVINTVRASGRYQEKWNLRNARGTILPCGYYLLSFTSEHHRKTYGIRLLK